MAKKNDTTIESSDGQESPYVNVDAKPKRSLKTASAKRGWRIGAIVAGSTLALGAAFGVGLTAGHLAPANFGPGIGQGQFQGPDGDRDGDHLGKPGGGFRDQDGQRPPRPNHAHDAEGNDIPNANDPLSQDSNQPPAPTDSSAPTATP